MTTYPAAGDYYKAVQAPARAFTVNKLQTAQFVWDSLGPTLARGSSAVVFQAAVEGSTQAVRCYIRNDASSRERYSALGDYLAGRDLDPFVSATTWTDSAIRVNGATWPVLQMGWIDGRNLNEYVDYLVAGSNVAALTTLANRWRELIALLQEAEFAHGDLQHGNVLVDQDGMLRLVDFDGIWIPQLAGMPPPTEYGHPNYQHPTQRVWGRWLDTFSALVIYLSLVALAKNPGLWLALYNSKNLLFSKPDFSPPFETATWKQLAALHDPQVDKLARRLQACCDPSWVSNISLEMTLDQQAATPPPPPPVLTEQRWWEKEPVTPATPAQPAWPWTTGSQARTPGSQPGTTGSQPGTTGSRPGTKGPQPAGQPAQPAAAASLPAPPPLSAPLGQAGTGPMPQLRQTMAPGDTIWWTGSAKPGPAKPAPPPGPPATKPHGSTSGAVTLGLGVMLLVIGAAINQNFLVFVGLLLGGGGIWWLIAHSGKTGRPPQNPKPPGQP